MVTKVSTDYFDFVIQKYGCIAAISFTKCKKELPASTPIEFVIPEGYRPIQLITKMAVVGRNKLSTYFYASASGSAGITIYDGLANGNNIYAEIFYFAKP